MSLLGELVELFNQRFGESLTDADAVHPAQALIDHIDRKQSATLRPQAASNEFDDFLRGKEPFVIDGALDAGKVSADFFPGGPGRRGLPTPDHVPRDARALRPLPRDARRGSVRRRARAGRSASLGVRLLSFVSWCSS